MTDIHGGFFYWSAIKVTKSQPLKEFSEMVLPKKRMKSEKSLSTRTGPTLQQDQFKYFDFFSENLLRFDTQNFSGGTVSGPVQVL